MTATARPLGCHLRRVPRPRSWPTVVSWWRGVASAPVLMYRVNRDGDPVPVPEVSAVPTSPAVAKKPGLELQN